MARILAISSQVARGHVGLAAIVPGLQALGHEVIGLPTVQLSNHPGHRHVAGERTAPELLARMLDAIAANGWLGDIDAVLTGYLPSPEHVAFARAAVERVRAINAAAVYLCDPVIGDTPKGVYIPLAAAEAIRDQLVPLADIVKLNAFELEWLTSQAWSPERLLAHDFGVGWPAITIATSVMHADATRLLNVTVEPERASRCEVGRRDGAPHGTGDLFSGLALGFHLDGCDWPAVLGRTAAAVDHVLAESVGRDELQIGCLQQQDLWRLPALAVDSIPAPTARRGGA